MASMRVAGKIIVAVVALAVLASAVVAQNEDTSVFRVDLPVTLRAKYPHSEALFGLPSYGGSISGRVIYGTPHLNHTGCNEIQPDPEWPDEPILMIDRGQCDFVRKVRNAELAGAVAVVIADNQGLCGYGTCADVPCDCSVPPVRDCECRMPFMADDGSGGDVNIPSFLLSRYHTDKFKQCILGTAPEGELCHQPTPVVATMEWSLPRRDGQVIFDFWTTAEELAAADFRREIAYLIEPLGTSIRFTPHFFIYDGAKWGCTREFNGNFACGSQCVSSGRYCSPDPDGGFDTGRSGGDVVAENLRQMCIWKQSNETYPLDFGIRWWKYASLFDTQCAEGDVEWGECSSSQQWAAGLDPGVTNECVEAAGGVDERGPVNELLEAEVRLRDDLVIVTLPTVVINDVIERGSTTANNVLATLCAGFVEGTQPTVCKYCRNVAPEALEQCLKNAEAGSGSGSGSGDGPHGQNTHSGAGPPEDSSLPGWAAALLVLLVLVVIGLAVGGYVVYKKLKSKIDEFDYRALGDDPARAPAALTAADDASHQWGSIAAGDGGGDDDAADEAGGGTADAGDVELRGDADI